VVVDVGAVELSWAASADASSGYHIYRKSSNDDRFERITTQPSVDTSFVDPDYLPGTRDYMVRGIGLESGSGGSYYNASQGTFSSVTLSSSEDYDGDGYSGDAGDCDDGNNHTYPGAAEVPDGQDNDCDGEVDEDTSSGCGGPGLGSGLRGSAVAGLLGLVLVRLRRRR
jgi:hypothetical protein